MKKKRQLSVTCGCGVTHQLTIDAPTQVCGCGKTYTRSRGGIGIVVYGACDGCGKQDRLVLSAKVTQCYCEPCYGTHYHARYYQREIRVKWTAADVDRLRQLWTQPVDVICEAFPQWTWPQINRMARGRGFPLHRDVTPAFELPAAPDESAIWHVPAAAARQIRQILAEAADIERSWLPMLPLPRRRSTINDDIDD